MATKKSKKSTTEIDDPLVGEESIVEAVDDDDDDDDSEYSTAAVTADGDADEDSGAAPIPDDHMVDYSVKSREAARLALNDQIAAFLSRGGQISHVDNNVTADPPKKPTSNYGSRPI